MSVINKMLRDLDSRQAAGMQSTEIQALRTAVGRGSRIMADSEPTALSGHGSARLAAVVATTAMVLAGAAGAWWYWNQNIMQQSTVAQPGMALATKPAPSLVASPVAAPLAKSPADNVSAVAVARVEPKAVASSVPVAAVVKAPASVKLSVPYSLAEAADVSLKMDSPFKSTPSPDAPSRPHAAGTPRPLPERSSNTSASALAPPITAAATVAPSNDPRLTPTVIALAQAQSLWSAGSHAAAIDLLREALAAAERANLVGTPSGNRSELVLLARELARMDLIEGRPGPALEMLTRLEPALSGFADIWAIRGNAAQRLGRHQESVAAYLMALKLRPDEPRWMLGAAVSLAAQGQTSSAAELAEKARVGGLLSPEVAAYLRQLGVPLLER